MKKFESKTHLAECIRKGKELDGPMLREGYYARNSDGKIVASCPLGYGLIGLLGKEEVEELTGEDDEAETEGLITEACAELREEGDTVSDRVITAVDNLWWELEDVLAYLDGEAFEVVKARVRARHEAGGEPAGRP